MDGLNTLFALTNPIGRYQNFNQNILILKFSGVLVLCVLRNVSVLLLQLTQIRKWNRFLILETYHKGEKQKIRHSKINFFPTLIYENPLSTFTSFLNQPSQNYFKLYRRLEGPTIESGSKQEPFRRLINTTFEPLQCNSLI